MLLRGSPLSGLGVRATGTFLSAHLRSFLEVAGEPLLGTDSPETCAGPWRVRAEPGTAPTEGAVTPETVQGAGVGRARGPRRPGTVSPRRCCVQESGTEAAGTSDLLEREAPGNGETRGRT